MKQILKRLEIIKSSIAIDDEEIIELQIIKLKQLDIDDDIKNILEKLENLDYGSAMNDIENYIKRYTGIVEYVDSEVTGLKLELKSLEKKLQSLSQEKTEYLNDIEEFNTQYNLHLGDIIENILKLKKEILYKQTIKQQKLKDKYKEDTQIYEDNKNTIDEIKEAIKEFEELLKSIEKDDENYDEIIQTYNDLKEELNNLEDDLITQETQLKNIKEDLENDVIFEEYEEAKASYEEFHNEYEDIKEKQSDRLELKNEDIKELKTLWKKACRLCHPDIVTDELKEKANEIMQSLNEAYSKRDLSKIKQILLTLENGLVFEVSSDKIDNKQILKSKIEEFRQNITDIEEEIENIKADDTFKTISNLENWDEYFEELKNKLRVQEKRLEDESRVILEEKKEVKNTEIEISQYSENLYKMSQPSINRIIQANESIINIEDENSELVGYIVDNGKSEKAKLYSAYDELLEDYLDDETINIIDWNCGQALGSSILLDYIREKDIELSISNIVLIEPVIKALNRGLLHIDVLKDEEYDIKTINKNIDDLNDSDLLIENSNINLHIFSNAFNMNHFDIDTLCTKFDNYQGINYFVLISPNKNINLDRFYDYFDDNYDVELISKRDKNIGDYARYEIIFKVEI